MQRSSSYCSSLRCVPIARERKSPATALRGHVRPPCFAPHLDTCCWCLGDAQAEVPSASSREACSTRGPAQHRFNPWTHAKQHGIFSEGIQSIFGEQGACEHSSRDRCLLPSPNLLCSLYHSRAARGCVPLYITL